MINLGSKQPNSQRLESSAAFFLGGVLGLGKLGIFGPYISDLETRIWVSSFEFCVE